jgi:hypothetical protein
MGSEASPLARFLSRKSAMMSSRGQVRHRGAGLELAVFSSEEEGKAPAPSAASPLKHALERRGRPPASEICV